MKEKYWTCNCLSRNEKLYILHQCKGCNKVNPLHIIERKSKLFYDSITMLSMKYEYLMPAKTIAKLFKISVVQVNRRIASVTTWKQRRHLNKLNKVYKNQHTHANNI